MIRPHDLDLSLTPSEGSEEAIVERVSHLGFEVRVELTLANGEHAWAQVTRKQDEELGLEQSLTVYARPSRAKKFEGEAANANGLPPTNEILVAS